MNSTDAEPGAEARVRALAEEIADRAFRQISVTLGSEWSQARAELIQLAIKRHAREVLLATTEEGT